MYSIDMSLDLPFTEDEFNEYMDRLETLVLSTIVASGLVGKRDTIPVRLGRLSKTAFGRKICLTLQSDVSFAVDYYGMLKKSSSLLQEIDWVREQLPGSQIKTIESLVIHFASVRIEHVARYCPDLIAGFPKFKKTVLVARGFKPKF